MSIRDVTARLVGAALLVAAGGGCIAHGGPPAGWLGPPGPGGPGGDGYGAWVEVRTGFARDDFVAGELIACWTGSVWVLTERGLRSVPFRSVRWLRLHRTGDTRRRTGAVDMKTVREAELRPWARYPQGLPRGFDAATLRPKPIAAPGTGDGG
jgi:hypothetical protein